MNRASQRQLNYLRGLGYRGSPPLWSHEASFLIDGLKSGQKPAKLEKAMLKKRAKIHGSWFKTQRGFAKGDIRQAIQSEGVISGFMLRIGRTCHGARGYDGVYVPIQVARKYPEVLPPYAGVCIPYECECEIEDVLEDDRLPLKTRMVIRPRKVVTISRHRSMQSLQQLAAAVIVLVAAYYLFKYIF